MDLKSLLNFIEIFVEKKWVDRDEYLNTLKRFEELIKILDDDEILLIIELLKKYEWVSYNDYNKSLRQLLKQLRTEIEGKTKVYFFPIIKQKDEQKTKSGHAVMYMLTALQASIDEYKNITFKELNKFQDLKYPKLNLTESDYLVLVDDYIGTGNTLLNTLDAISKNDTLENKFSILTVAIQEQAKKLLDEKGIKNFYSLIMNKGLSDNYEGFEFERRIKIMRKLEKRISKLGTFSFGYEKSEALITLIKTPNNTFPIFWKDVKDDQKELIAPFSRY